MEDGARSSNKPKKFIVLRSFLGDDDARLLVQEVLACHGRNGSDDLTTTSAAAQSSASSLQLDLGIPCGGDLNAVLPRAVAVARRAYQEAAGLQPSDRNRLLKIAQGPLSGLSLLYGLSASMASHYDSPTQPGQREEWLAMVTLGNSALFRCNDEVVELHSGDALVMDSMSVLHGVDGVLVDDSAPTMSTKLGLPMAQARLGILLWQGRDMSRPPSSIQEAVVEGMHDLFDEMDV